MGEVLDYNNQGGFQVQEMKLLAEWSYTPAKPHRGYTRQTLYVGLGNKDGNYRFESRPVSDDMIDTFIGGRGFGLKLLWDAVKPESKWNDPENEIISINFWHHNIHNQDIKILLLA